MYGPTHTGGHTIDLVIAPESNSVIQSVQALNKLLSDHHFIKCKTTLEKQKPPKTKVTSRDLKSLDIIKFRADLSNMFSSPVDSCDQFENACRQIIDKHAPMKTRTVTERTVSPWFSLEQKQLKQEKRRAERKWRKTDLCIHKNIYLYLKNKVNSINM